MSLQTKLRTSLQENSFIIPSFSHYGGASGFQDYGILGTIVKNRFLDVWRNCFLKNTDVFEIEAPIIMPYDVLKASGHVDRFTDYVVYDQNNICHRADHLVKNWFKDNRMIDKAEKVDLMTINDLENAINDYKMMDQFLSQEQQPAQKVKVTTKNLMFTVPSNSSHILSDFMRPELAQGIFVNFKSYYSFLRDLPFGIAQIGKSYRNEISPCQLTRMREFTQAEIEYFVDPNDKSHPLFDKVKHKEIPIYTVDAQLASENPSVVSLEVAVSSGMISHETMAYYLGKIYDFAVTVGLDPKKMRFRQHLPHEMAHYANQCWDLETFVNGDWLECVGCADRGDYDLKAHSKFNELCVKRQLDTPIIVCVKTVVIDKKQVGKLFGSLSAEIYEYFESLNQEEIEKLVNIKDNFEIVIKSGNTITILPTMIQVVESKIKKLFEEYYPHVIEPSFGVDRLLYSIFEHNFWTRKDSEKRVVLSLPAILTPYDIAVFELLQNRQEIKDYAKYIRLLLTEGNLRCYLDKSNVSIGRRYSRLDEIGVKYAITVDPQSLEDQTVTIRDRDTTNQIRVKVGELLEYLNSIIQ